MSSAGDSKRDKAAVLDAGLKRVYDAYRTSLLNVKYYGYRLKWANRVNLIAEITIAVSTASGVSGLAIFKTGSGVIIWSIIAGSAAILTAIKPIFPFSRNIAAY